MDDDTQGWFNGKLLYWVSLIGKSVALVGGAATFALQLIDIIFMAALDYAIAQINALELEAFAPDMGLVHGMEIVNAVIPVTEFVAMFGAFGVAWGVLLVVRWIKSFVPTIAN